MLGNNKVTRWLFTMCEISYDDETLWIPLIDFLEKYVQVQQQKVLIQNKMERKKQIKGIMLMANKIGDSKAMLEPVQLEKLIVPFVTNQRNMLQEMDQKNQISTNILHIRWSLK